MAFNFNWSPLAADASFYTRAQDLLTTALNKSPKPPIIVDDIIVNELNLGSLPPDLEILEIGDLAEDRFRGIFKMCYGGDAFLTLRTRVQANPLNTYLSTKPSFTSPQPLAASSGLTIPLQITLSDIKLSAFIILVFSKQKGLTIVFRNDPLESLKVSSTFDGIPFVREYLQKEIEGQLRTLLMDEVPLIIHRLSLRLFVPEHREKEDQQACEDRQETSSEEKPVDPLASPPQDPVDISGNVLDPSQIASLSLDSGSEMHALFSQKNLLRLGALTDSHRTLSLFTPSMRDVLFRAWARPIEHGETRGSSGIITPASPILTRAHSFAGNLSTTYTFSDSKDSVLRTMRPPLSSFDSAASGLGMGGSKPGKTHVRKKKRRVVNLRKKATDNGDEVQTVSGEGSTISGTMSSASSEYGRPTTPPQRESELPLPKTPEQRSQEPGDADVGNTPPRASNQSSRRQFTDISEDVTPRQSQYLPKEGPEPRFSEIATTSRRRPSLRASQSLQHVRYSAGAKLAEAIPSSPIASPLQETTIAPVDEPSTNVMFGQAWIEKMAGEIARKARDQKDSESGFWNRNETDEAPPPAYGA